ncbi:MAG: peptidyl-prolyl cis-trans isomerase [Syntrophorhabdaceae bacterium]|nr:peptidyl-prolyl cis-trans isomerase [Syntrophorhabdaceae bacterium]
MSKLYGIFLVILSLMLPAGIQGEVVDRIIAIVNDDIITLKDVERYVHVEKQGKYTSVNEYLRNLELKEKIDIFINDMLIKQQAKKLKIDISDREVEGIVENVKKQNLITETELREQLKKENITYKDFRDGIKMNILRSRVLARVISPEVKITDDDLKEYYDKHLNEFKEEEYRLKQIFVSGQRQDGAQRAMAAYKLLSEGKPFEDVAAEWSDDPSAKTGADIGYVKKEDLMPQLKQSLSQVTPGSYTQVIQTPYGFNILKLVDVKKSGTLPFDAAKDAIRGKVVFDESEKRYKEYINKLRKSSYIEVKI